VYRRTASWLAILAAAVGVAFAQQPDHFLRIICSEPSLPDSGRSALADLLSHAVPVDEWRTETVLPSDLSPEMLIRRLYSVFNSGQPGTLAVLKSAIEMANHVNLPADYPSLVGKSIRVPPLPRKGYETYGFPDPRATVYDVRKSSYYRLATADILSPLRFDAQPETDPASQHDTSQRQIRVPLSSRLEAALGLARYKSLLDGYLIVSDSPSDRIVKLTQDQAAAAPCAAAVDWLSASPYRALWNARAASLTPAMRQQIRSLAAANKLFIADWSIGETVKGHGSRVRDVVSMLLAGLGFPELDSAATIEELDLNPINNQAGLEQLLTDYKKTKLLSGKDADRFFDEAFKWIGQRKPEWSDPSKDVDTHELVLQALFWRFFRTRSGIANFSFGFESPTINAIRAAFFDAPNSFALSAAGNLFQISATSFPQALAATFPARVVNVTYGLPNGEVLGAAASPFSQAPIATLAPGCGYRGRIIQPSDRGSSFAAPFASTALWLAGLLSLAQHTPNSAWLFPDAALLASRPIPTPANAKTLEGIQSGGFFDPFLLLSGVGHHAIMRDGSLVELAGIAGEVQFLKGAKRIIVTPPAVDGRGFVLAPYPCGAGTCAWYREIASEDKTYQGQLVISSMSLNLRLKDGGTVSLTSKEDFAGKYRELWYLSNPNP